MRYSQDTRQWLRELRDVYSAEKDQPRTRKKLLTIQIQICDDLLLWVNYNSVTNPDQQQRVQRHIEERAEREIATDTIVARSDFVMGVASFLNTCK